MNVLLLITPMNLAINLSQITLIVRNVLRITIYLLMHKYLRIISELHKLARRYVNLTFSVRLSNDNVNFQ